MVAGKSVTNSLSTGSCRDDRGAEIAMHEMAEIVEELPPDRLVEADFVAQLGEPLRRDAALAGAHLDRIARHQADRTKVRTAMRERSA